MTIRITIRSTADAQDSVKHEKKKRIDYQGQRCNSGTVSFQNFMFVFAA